MDSKILNFVIGIIVGICITSAGFLIYMKLNNNLNAFPNKPEDVRQMREFNKNGGGEFYKEELKNFNNENIENRNEGDINSNIKEESKGVPPSVDSTNNK